MKIKIVLVNKTYQTLYIGALLYKRHRNDPKKFVYRKNKKQAEVIGLKGDIGVGFTPPHVWHRKQEVLIK